MICPLMSNAEHQVQCTNACRWYTKLKDGKTKCEINYLTDKLAKIEEKIDEVSDTIWRKPTD